MIHLVPFKLRSFVENKIDRNNKLFWRDLAFNANAIHILEKNLDKVDWNYLASNPNAIHILEKYPTGIDWYILQLNSNAVQLLEKNMDKIEWSQLATNINATHLLENQLNNFNNIAWSKLSVNPCAIHILKNNPSKICYYELSSNPNSEAMVMIEEKLKTTNQNDISWSRLSENPSAIHILENNLNKISWSDLSANPNAIHMLEQNINKIDWNKIQFNPNAIDLMEKNIDKINWIFIAYNLNIFEIDIEKVFVMGKQKIKQIIESLTKRELVINYLCRIYGYYHQWYILKQYVYDHPFNYKFYDRYRRINYEKVYDDYQTFIQVRNILAKKSNETVVRVIGSFI